MLDIYVCICVFLLLAFIGYIDYRVRVLYENDLLFLERLKESDEKFIYICTKLEEDFTIERITRQKNISSVIEMLDKRIIEVIMDKKIEKIQKDTKDLQKQEGELLKMDKKHDKVIAKAKKKMKGKC